MERSAAGWPSRQSCLGLTAASKYLYCTVGIAVLAHWLDTSFPKRKVTLKTLLRWLLPPLVFSLIALAVFFAADPYLWPDPVNRLKDSILFHSAYAQSGEVSNAALPFYQPLAYLLQSVPWHPGVFKFNLELVVFPAGAGRDRAHRPAQTLHTGVVLS